MNNLLTDIINTIQRSISEYAGKISEKYNIDSQELVDLWNNLSAEMKIEKKIEKKREIKEHKNKPEKKSQTDEKEEKNLCKYLFSKPPRKGELCNVKVRNGGNYCSKHKQYEGKEQKKISVIPKPIKDDIKIESKEENKLDENISNRKIYLIKNKILNKYWHTHTKFVFDSKENKIVIGRSNNNKLCKLTPEDIELCKKYNFKYDETYDPCEKKEKNDEIQEEEYDSIDTQEEIKEIEELQGSIDIDNL